VTTEPVPERPRGLRAIGDAFADLAGVLLERGVGLEEAVQAFEARYVREAVVRSQGNLSQAASLLGIHRNTVRNKLKRNGGRPRDGS
jgi:DNA-binding NtrC family response regulator